MNGLLLAVDGGNAKTDLALLDREGRVLALVRGPGSSPHEHGVEGALDRIEALVIEAGAEGPVEHAELLLAGVDFPSEVSTFRARAQERGWGVAVVCGAGINCLGLGPDGREARFPALGDITGDWGGGQDVGAAAVTAAARSEDGRGPKTSLEQLVPAHFGFETPLQLAEAVHVGSVTRRRFVELAPLVFAEATGDAVAEGIVLRLADEIVSLVRVALDRIGPIDEPADVVLGGGLLQARNARLLDAIETELAQFGVPHTLIVVDAPPVVGAALRALDALGAEPSAHARLRNDERLAEVVAGG